jgi:asparagine synthase (glutamine-hydrolysing)
MGSIAAHLGDPGAHATARVSAMLASAPHRGDRVSIVTLGRCVIGASARPDFLDTSVAVREGLAGAVVGRVDNAADLERQIARAGDRPLVDLASLLIEAFRIFGTTLPSHLRGAFAVVLTDGTSLHSFRDHLGFCSLFYRRDDAGLFVASEAKQVIAGAGIPTAPDLHMMERIFYETYDDERLCALRGVSRLPRATVMTVSPEKVLDFPYWHPERVFESARLSGEALQSRFDELMGQAVERVLTGDDVLTLSGGIDSPAIAAFAAPAHLRLTGRPLAALTAVYPEFPSVDERRYAELIAERLGIDLHLHQPTASPLDGLEQWVRLADGPFPTTSMAEAHEMYELARTLGFRNVLTGEVAEFLMDFRGSIVPHLVARGRVSAAARHVRTQRTRGVPVGDLVRQVVAAAIPASVVRILARGRQRQSRFLPEWVDAPSWTTAERPLVAPRHRWRGGQLSAFAVGPALSLEADETVQALSGVRVRRPWADVELWEFFLSLPAEVKFPDLRSKTLVRRLLRGKLPDEILDRRSKTVFDDVVRARIDYGVLRRWLLRPDYRVPGVNYDKLAAHLEREDLDTMGFIVARDLAAVHAFVGQW